MDFVGPILEILKCIGPPLCKYIEYHRKREEYKQNLKRILEELKSQKDEIETRLKVECGVGKLRKNEVKHWLKNVEMIIHDAENVEQTFKNGKCLSRVCQAKLFEKKIQQVQEYFQKGNSFNTLVIDAPPSAGIILPTTPLVGETTAKKNMEEIWRHLMDKEIKNVGIFGMGGIGKTTIMTHINNRLIEENKFDHVIWVTISQTLDLVEVQNGIANSLKKHLSSIKDQKARAGELLSMLRGERFVLILDDIWDVIQLEELGIPEPTKENGCKLVITTRSLDVCRSMKCKTVEVKPLSENEALDLFFEKAELDISKVPTLKETAELVVKQCAGLPLAIVTIASSLKGEEDIREWTNAISELTNKVRSIKVRDDEVFVRLKFSFDRLKDEKIQRCFLYCALYPEDHDIPKTELVDYWIAEGLVEEMDNLQATEDRAHIMIKRLVNNCLLLESINRRERSCVKVHDVVRDMVLRYITSESPLFMVKAGLKLKELPSGQHWKENLDKVSLMNNFISEIPSSISPKCPILSTLFLQYNPLESIPESFFSQMHGLMILNLSGTEIKSLPNSISELTSLTALLLNNCYRLKQIPSLAKLQALQILDLGFTAMNEVPTGLEMLTNLTNLDLYSTELHNIPAGIFPKLCRLQKLVINWGLETERVAVLSVAYLQNLIVLLNLSESTPPDQYSHLKGVRIYSCPKVKKLFSSKLLLELKNLEWIDVSDCDEMEELITIDDEDDDDNEERSQKEFLLPKLKKLSLCGMPELKSICSSNGVMVCDSLQEIVIWGCPQLKRLPLYLPVDEKGQPSPPPALQKIDVHREWWEALEWDHLHPDAKTLLLPFCKFD
ncbi:hypothetical protein ACOSP7_021650 [Xanthoceras sorbifolium]